MAVTQRATMEPGTAAKPPLASHRLVRAGAYSWAILGLLGLVVVGAIVLGRLMVIVVPLVLALFPAAVLSPLTRRLMDRRVPPALAALLVLFGALGLVAGVFTFIAPQVQRELGDVGASLQQGYGQIGQFLQSGPFGLAPINLDQLVGRLPEQLGQVEGLGGRAIEVVSLVAEGFAGFVLLLFALFFYLKDGPKIGAWLRSLFPAPAQDDAEQIGGVVWLTIGGYIRGQLLIALVDAVFIGIGLFALRIPLALPLAVFVFFGALFPIVGAIASGFVAVVVALATEGVTRALLVLLLIVAVQQLESHLLAPIVLGRSTQLHPLAVISALTAGGVLLGVLGAFIAVPVAASVARAIGYLRGREPAPG
ncbi:MAG: AI-2E family transporter [Egibacteraceae bacterium]